MTVTAVTSIEDRFDKTLDRLIQMSKADAYDPLKDFVWPASIPEDQLWMSEHLLSVAGTPAAERLSREQLIALSKWESINFFSLNVSGIRELLLEVMSRIHTPAFERSSEYLHYFVGEENEHMWYFARFCMDYGGKIYNDRRVRFEDAAEPDVQHFLTFVKILIFEEIVDFYNSAMAADETLHSTIRDINRLHHLDETRHITFGRQNVELLHLRLRETYPEERLREIERFLKRYMNVSVQKLYNPEIYKDAGIPEPHKLRNELLRDPYRQRYHQQLLARTVSFFVQKGIFLDADLTVQ